MTVPGWTPSPVGDPVGPIGPLEPPGSPHPLEWMRRQQFDRRVVVLSGTLDDRMATEVAAELMTLDATGDDPVELQIDSADGSVDAALALMDVIDLMGVPVHAWCTGRAGGPVVGVLAVCDKRTASPHARLQLAEPRVEFDGDARSVGHRANEHLRRWRAFCARLAEAAGRTVEAVSDDAARGRYLSADEAVGYGILDEVAGADITRLPGARIGFRPR